MSALSRFPKYLLYFALVLLAVVVLLYVFHPPMVRWAIKTYSPEFTGRQITVEHIRFEPFTGRLYVEGLKVLEADGKETFLEVKDIFVNATLYKMIGGTYEVTAIHLNAPKVSIIQLHERFNFTDLIERFASSDTVPEKGAPPTPFALYDIMLNAVQVAYSSSLVPKPIQVERANFICPMVKWDVANITAAMELLLANGSEFRANIDFDKEQMLYAIDLEADSVPCRIMGPFVEPYMHISELQGNVLARLLMKGAVHEPMHFALKGRVGIQQFAMLDPQGVKLIGLERMDLRIDTVNIKEERYRIRRFVLDRPYIFAELYDESDNYSKLLTTADSTTVDPVGEELGYDPENPFSLLAHYVKMVAQNYSTMNYKVDSLGIIDGSVVFNDFTLEQPFHYVLSDLTITADAINSSADEILVSANAVLNEDGIFKAELGLDPASKRNMRIDYSLEGVGLPVFGPYTVHYVAHPIESGRSKYVSNTTIIDNKLNSVHRIVVEDLNFGKKMEVADAYNVPMRLAVSLMKDKDGLIDLRIPIEGDLDDPEYKVWPIIWQVVKNLITKAISAPGAALARAFDADEDDLKAVRFEILQQDLHSTQEKPLNILSRVVLERSGIHIELVQVGDPSAEAEAYAIRTAKAAYYADSTGSAIDTTVKDLNAMLADVDIRSPGFRAWLDQKVDPADEPVQVKCMKLIGAENANSEVERLGAVRQQLVRDYLRVERELPADAITIRTWQEGDTIARGGVPAFIATYHTTEEP